MNITLSTDVTQYLALVAYLGVLLNPQQRLLTTAYHTVIIYYDPACPAFDAIVRSVHTDALVPTKVYPLVAPYWPLVSRQTEPKHLDLFLFTSSEHFHYLDGIHQRRQTSAHRLVLVMDADESHDMVERRAERHLSILQRYLLVRANGMVLWQRNHMLRLALDLFDANGVRAMMRRVYASRAEDLARWNATVYVHFNPPFSMLTPMDDAVNNLQLIGPDTLMAYDIAEALNATAVLCTDVQLLNANFHQWFKPGDPHSGDLSGRYYSPRIVLWRPLYVFDFNDSVNAADLYISSIAMKVNVQQDNLELLENLYPHDTNCLIVLVPTSKVRESFLHILLRRSILGPICLMLLLMALVRIAQRRQPIRDAVLFTWGLFLSQQFLRHPRTLSECMWISLMLAFAFYAVTMLSTTIYTIVVTTNYMPEIDTLQQLLESGLPVVMQPPEEEDSWNFTKLITQITFYTDYCSLFEIFTFNVSPVLQSRTHYTNVSHLWRMILVEANTTYAYVMRRSKAAYFITLLDFAASNDGPLFRIMKEALECGLIAYQVLPKSPYREAVDRTIQRSREGGLYHAYVDWTFRYLKSVYRALPLPDAKHSRPVGWQGISGVFYVYTLGVTLASVAFLVERTMRRTWCRKAAV